MSLQSRPPVFLYPIGKRSGTSGALERCRVMQRDVRPSLSHLHFACETASNGSEVASPVSPHRPPTVVRGKP